MKRSIWKDTGREIARTANRFLAILVIVALGVAFYTGLKAVGPDMNRTATEYFAQTNLMDFKVVSNVGFTGEDVTAVAALDGIDAVQPGYTVDAMLTTGADSRVVRVLSLPARQGGINGLSLVEGRLPQAADECVVDNSRRNEDLGVGSMVTLTSGTEDALSEKLSVTTFTVVGVVDAPDYLNRDRGASAIGNGRVTGLLWVPGMDFHLEYFTTLTATMAGSGGVMAFGEDYDALAAAQDERLTALATQREATRQSEILDEANTTLGEKQRELDDARAEADADIGDAQDKLDDANQKLEDGVQELADKRDEANEQFADADRKLADAERKLKDARRELEQQQEAYEDQSKDAERAFDQAQAQIDESKEKIATQEAALAALRAQLQQGMTDGTLTEAQIGALRQQIAQGEAAIAQAQAQVKGAEDELATQREQLVAAGAKLDEADKKLDSNEATLRRNKAELADKKEEAEQEFADAEDEIAEKRQELADAQAELDDAKAEADGKLTDAQTQLNDARQDIADLPDVNWTVLGRDDNAGYADFAAAIGRTDGLASVFPVFFFVIAALVCLTTMTRMVDQQRTQIGTLKALGYGKGAIAFKYLFYAGAASLAGSAVGLTVGVLALPRVVMLAYARLYTLPDLLTAFWPVDAAVAVLLAVGVTVAAAIATCWRELAGVPATLMRPQAPKAGRRVLLERVGFLWRRLSFSHKVTVRNLLRYQKRFWMTVLGVACCSGLLLTGLGLRDSVATKVSDRQFGEIFHYDLAFQTGDDVDEEERAAVDGLLGDVGATATAVRMEGATAANGSTQEKCQLLVALTPEELPDYITLRDPRTAQPLALEESGAVLTEKLAETLGVAVGDTVTLTDNDDRQAQVRVAAIAENYLAHYAVLSPAAYRQAFGAEAETNQRFVNLSDGMDEDARQALATALNGVDGVSNVRFQQENIDDFHDIIQALDYIVWVILAAATVLAFTVLYTLTSINIAERFREIATLKVLGFYDRESAAYVFRESYILTVIGIGLGMALGVGLHALVLGSLEVDAVMFVQQVLPASYAISAALTLAFTWVVNRLAMGKLARINMVEALKGVE